MYERLILHVELEEKNELIKNYEIKVNATTELEIRVVTRTKLELELNLTLPELN